MCVEETGGDFPGAQGHLEGHGEMVRMEARVMGWGWAAQGFGGLTLQSLDTEPLKESDMVLFCLKRTSHLWCGGWV